MWTPSSLGDFGFPVSHVQPLSTSTARFIALRNTTATDTGTVATTSRTLDLSRAIYFGATGGKPFDATIHPRKPLPRWKSITVAIPLELQFHSSGKHVMVTVAHKHRSATSGAGSTWATIKTDVKKFKMGTDTDAVFHTGFASSINAIAVARYYKANITFGFRKASSTAAADTTTDVQLVSNSPVFILTGGDAPQSSVPATI